MSSRLASAPVDPGSSYYEHQQQQLSMQAASKPTTLHYPTATHVQQRLQDFRQSAAVGGGYDGARYPSAYANYPYGPEYTPPGPGYLPPHHHPHPHAHLAHQYPPTHSHTHYDSLYGGRLLGAGYGSSGSAMYNGRARYLPYAHYPQQQSHTHAGMFTPAGQQLIPSSVLHYPPHSSAYPLPHSPYAHPLHYRQQQQQHQQQHYQTQAHAHAMYEAMHAQYQSPQLYTSAAPVPQSPHSYLQSPMREARSEFVSAAAAAATASAPYYNPYANVDRAIPQEHYPATPRSNINSNEALETPINAINATSTSDTKAPADSCREQLAEHAVGALCSPAGDAAVGAAAADCLTTSPPLISATGTDSGISSCSMRARSDDSTRSTPIYNGEYPLSVGSSSGVSYNCATDAKDNEDALKEGDAAETGETDTKRGLTESNEAQNDDQTKHEERKDADKLTDVDEINIEPNTHIVKEELKDNDDTNNVELRSSSPSTAATATVKEKEPHTNAINKTDGSSSTAQHHHQQINANQAAATLLCSASKQPTSGAEPRTNPSSVIDHCTTPFPSHITSAYASQQQQQQQQQQQKLHKQKPKQCTSSQMLATNAHLRQHSAHLNVCASSWSPFPSSPNSWMQQYSPKFKRQHSSSPLPVPVPPHNSPVSCSYPAHPANSAASVSSAMPTAHSLANKNRIIECDLIPSKKSKRKSAAAKGKEQLHGDEDEEKDDNVREEIRNITPLPGFQQAFGSTEIGRFSETFLLTPTHNITEEPQYEEGLNTEYAYNGGQYSTPMAWSSYEASDYSRSRGASKMNLHFDARSYAMRDYLAYERYSYNYGRGRNLHGNGLSEIRCNGY